MSPGLQHKGKRNYRNGEEIKLNQCYYHRNNAMKFPDLKGIFSDFLKDPAKYHAK